MTEFQGLEPDRSPTAMLILDMISRFEFPDGAATARAAARIAPNIRALRDRVRKAGFAVIYANDNPGMWRSDAAALIRDAGAADSRGREITALLRPTEDDYFVLKPRHSAFYATPLELLLEHLHVERLILTGVSGHQCVLFTANEAHVRNYEIVVASDCVGSPEPAQTRFALTYFRTALSAKVIPQARWRPERKRRR
jgi:nicotinamidase-related amidase